MEYGAPGEITPGILPSALRAGLRPFKFVPDEFVELTTPAFGGQYSIQLSYGRLVIVRRVV